MTVVASALPSGLRHIFSCSHHRVRSWLLLPCVAAMVACGGATGDDGVPDASAVAPARDALTADGIMRHINVLAHDSLEGRAPGGVGEERTVRYLTEQFQSMGLKPGNPDGRWVQNVQLVGITSRAEAFVTRDGETRRLSNPRDYVVTTRYPQEKVAVNNSEMVFVGYGVVAPEANWDDFKNVDVRGKTVVMLVNDPPVRTASGDSLDPNVFKGNAMSYYGRWTYKYEIASARGAAAVLIVHETESAGYPYLVVIGSWGRENFDINIPGGAQNRVQVEGWLHRDAADTLFSQAGFSFDSLKAVAATREFTPVSLGATVSFNLENKVRQVASRNVVAKLEGNDPSLNDEWVIFTAHWDHLGRDTMHQGGDQIFNGALDNASGTAALLEIAGAMARLPERTPRSLLFVALTAEEQGLLGAKWYAEQPLYPLHKTLANINMDGINQWGRTRDITVIGFGNSTLDDVLRTTIERDGRTLSPDPEPEKGYFFRSDHFEFAKKGVPALYTGMGSDFIDKPADFAELKRAEYNTNDYHKPSDEVKPDWDLSGAVEDTRALLEVGWRVAHLRTWPNWAPSAEFRGVRDSVLAANPR